MARSSSRFTRLALAPGLALVLVCGVVVASRGAQTAQARPLSVAFTVPHTNDGGADSLRQAILDANANPGADVISITAAGTLDLLSALPAITDSVSVYGPGASQFRVDGQDAYRVFDIAGANATLSDLTVQRGRVTGFSEDGAGIRSNRALTLVNVNVLSNTAQGDGGGLFVAGGLTLMNGLFQNNQSTSSIGGAMRSLGPTTVSGTQFVSNTSAGDGGGAYVLEALTLTNGLFRDNRCTRGSCDGGGLFAFGAVHMSGTQFISNTAQDQGGGAAAPGAITLTNVLFQDNESTGSSGGGLFASGAANLSGTQFLSNTAQNDGGGIWASGAVTLANGLFQNNQSTNGAGGGLYAFGTAYSSGTQFVRNIAQRGGGFFHAFGNGHVVNSLFAGNIATTTLGSAMLLAGTGTVEVAHVTIASPAVASGSAIDVLSGTLGMTNTLIASHTIGISNTGGTVMQDYNLFFGNTANTQGAVSGGASSIVGNPKFVEPAGDDYHLSAGSAAIDTGVNAGMTSDIDGEARPQFTGFDIGFDEFIPLRIFLPVVVR